jgi:poly(3-hydroxybutyrate) depolymerase
MLYHLFEMTHAAVAPLRLAAHAGRDLLRNELNPVAWTQAGRTLAAALDVFESTTRRYGKPEWGLDETMIFGQPVPVAAKVVYSKPFCDLIHFEREPTLVARRRDPKVLIVAPLSGHYATLLRGTVQAMLPEHDVYVTDWKDARTVPLAFGRFDLEDYTDYLIDFLDFIGPGTHAMGVCQPGVPLLIATSVMAANGDPNVPASIVIMGSPIDTRRSPTVPNKLASERPIEWFERNVIMRVPFPHAGFMREVYPGFLQLTGFMTMNLERHMDAHYKLFKNLVAGDGDSAQSHREFYDEYLSVLDMTAEFYLQTVREVFQEHSLPNGTMRHRGQLVDPRAITRTALMTVEGEKDDISGIGQTQAAHDLCTGIPAEKRVDYIQPGVGHYGVFNGTRWRTEIQPRVRDFIRSNLKRG